MFSFLCGAVRPGWAGRLSSTSAEHLLHHTGEEGLEFFLDGGRVRAEPSPCVSHLLVTTGWAARQLAGRSVCGGATRLHCRSWLGLSVSLDHNLGLISSVLLTTWMKCSSWPSVGRVGFGAFSGWKIWVAALSTLFSFGTGEARAVQLGQASDGFWSKP